jgi:hypothetical protein
MGAGKSTAQTLPDHTERAPIAAAAPQKFLRVKSNLLFSLIRSPKNPSMPSANPLSGTGSRASHRGLPGCRKTQLRPRSLKGHDFSRAAKAIKSTWASAPEGCLPPISSEIPSFSATRYTRLRTSRSSRPVHARKLNNSHRELHTKLITLPAVNVSARCPE